MLIWASGETLGPFFWCQCLAAVPEWGTIGRSMVDLALTSRNAAAMTSRLNPQPDGVSAWQKQMAALAFDSGAASGAEQHEFVGLAFSLLQAMPQQLVQASGRGPVPDVAPLLGSGAPVEAALALLDGWAGYMLSCAPGGRAMATVVVESLGGEASAEGASPALALLGALAALLAGDSLDEDCSAQVDWRTTGARLN